MSLVFEFCVFPLLELALEDTAFAFEQQRHQQPEQLNGEKEIVSS